MIKKGLVLTAILPIVTVFLSFFFASPTYSTTLFIYEEEIMGIMGEKKQKMPNPLEDIYLYAPQEDTKEGEFWANYVFTNITVFDSQYPTVESIKEYRMDPPVSSNTTDYLALVIGRREEISKKVDIFESLLQYVPEEIPILAKSILEEGYFEEFLAQKEMEEDLRYQNIMDDVPARPLRDEESIFYAKSMPQEPVEKPVPTKIEPVLTERPKPSGSKDITLTITILPVRFVYVDNEYQIVKIWNNVKRGDSQYGLKFYDEETKREINGNDYIMAQFNSLLSQIDPFTEGFIYDRSLGIIQKDYAVNVDIQFNDREEIYTLI